MAHFFASRVAKLEARKVKPSTRASVIELNAVTGAPMGRIPPARRVMVATNFGTDAQWQIALLKQQTKLTARPYKEPPK